MSSVTPASSGYVLTRRDHAVAWIVLNRPDRMNALVGMMRDDLERAIADAAADDSVRVIVITGAGGAFCAGADVNAMAELLERDDEATFSAFMHAGMRVVRAIRSAPKPVVAAVNGPAAGAGASLALACDMRIASSAAALGITFNRIGLHPDWGVSYFLPRLIGRGRAAELIYTGRMVTAEEAAQIGLFERVIQEDSYVPELAEYLAGLAAKAALSIASAKETLGSREVNELEAAMEAEAEAQLRCFRSHDFREGVTAFLEKRAANFQ